MAGAGRGFFHFITTSILAMGPTQLPPVQWVLGAPSIGIKELLHDLTTHFHVVPRLRMCRAISPLPHTSSWHGA